MDRKTGQRGIITDVRQGKIYVSADDVEGFYPFPSALAETLILADEGLQEKYACSSSQSQFDIFKRQYSYAIETEILFLKKTGGKKYRIIDGERLQTGKNVYVYSFETDSELHFPDDTLIKLWLPDKILPAEILSCEGFNVVIQLEEYLGDKVETVEFTAEPWQLLEALEERLKELNPENSPLSYEVACRGRSQAGKRSFLEYGQQAALRKSQEQPVLFVWGPPGTGKTTSLSEIALDHMLHHERVLMLSYSNVSVDGALLKVAEKSDYPPGKILRYGYPRVKELLESDTLTSRSFALYRNPNLKKEYDGLVQKRNSLKKKDPARMEIRKKLDRLKEKILDQEKEDIQKASFLATTVSKAVVDKAIYTQKYDVVIFDEASMAYIPQIVFSASLAQKHFCCLGDFRQLPAIVQNPENHLLEKDIFEHTGITDAVEEEHGHNWLVMLNRQYRMHPEIASFVSRNIYGGLLESPKEMCEKRQAIADQKPNQKAPMSMIDLGGMYSVCIRTMDSSRMNLLSAMVCMKIAELYAGQYEVGIITPYSAQSKLILAMLRDLQERNPKFNGIRSATVHQFQGSEKSVIIYDAVDCFRIPYPGTLLTSQKNHTADRLFNVALTRSQGKFIMVANADYFARKHIQKDLMFSKAMTEMKNAGHVLSGEQVYYEIGTYEDESPEVFLGDRDEEDSWKRYLNDLKSAENEIFMDVPGRLSKDKDAVKALTDYLKEAEKRKSGVYIRAAGTLPLPEGLKKYAHDYSYAMVPVTVIDRSIIWYGEPLCAADFISEEKILKTKCFPCMRFEGKHTARMLKALLEIPAIKEESGNGKNAGTAGDGRTDDSE